MPARDNGPMDSGDRAAMDPAALGDRLAARWNVQVVAETGSTNADLLDAAGQGAPDGTVRVAHLQSGGRGRLDRSWQSPAGAGLTFSVLLRPQPPTATWGWLPLLAGVALVRAVGGDARLKWPNDLLLGPVGAKAAGILVQAVPGAAVVGVGLNVSTTAVELPVPSATSLSLAGVGKLDRAELLVDFLAAFDERYQSWQAHAGDAEASALAEDYRAACATIGSAVSVELPASTLTGQAVGLDSAGQLILRPDGGGAGISVAAGDVTHVRAVSR